MKTLDELKKQWCEVSPMPGAYDDASINAIVKSRVNKHTLASMHYFWASFALQVLVYSLLCHVMIKYFNDTAIVIPSVAGVLLFLPFTIILMIKFKGLAIADMNGSSVSSIHDYVSKKRELLRSFFSFKKRYELILIPISTAIGVLLTFALYVPGGITEHLIGSLSTYTISLLCCYVAIRNENNKSFIQPLQHLDMILEEYKLS